LEEEERARLVKDTGQRTVDQKNTKDRDDDE
jgi:hypothetical protein